MMSYKSIRWRWPDDVVVYEIDYYYMVCTFVRIDIMLSQMTNINDTYAGFICELRFIYYASM